MLIFYGTIGSSSITHIVCVMFENYRSTFFLMTLKKVLLTLSGILGFAFLGCVVGGYFIYKNFALVNSSEVQKISNILQLQAGEYIVLDGVDNGVSTSDGLRHELEYTIKNSKTGEICKIKENSLVHTPYKEGSSITIEKPGEFYVEWKDPSSP